MENASPSPTANVSSNGTSMASEDSWTRERSFSDHEIENNEPQDEFYPRSWTLGGLITGLCLAVFLLSMDRTIVTTAVPYISNQFHAFSDIGWYGSSYLLTSSALQPTFGRVYHFFDLKLTYIMSMIIFEIGSILSAAASSSKSLIVGRAITGVGSAGVLSGSFVIVAHSVPLQKRPVYTSGIGLFYSLGSVAGPLLGGVFTSEATWRWCFWINLPIGGLTILALIFLFRPQKQAIQSTKTLIEKLLAIDWIGTVMLLGASVTFFLALQYVDEAVPWSSTVIIGLLTGTGLLTLSFIVWQVYLSEQALIPPSIFFNRNVAFACLNSFFLYSALLVHTYYFSIWFQAVRGRSALLSGVDLIPYIVSTAIATIFAGIITSKTGYYAPPAWCGCALATIGAGLLTSVSPDEPTGNWVGYFILTGVGVGLAVQQGFTAVQAVLCLEQVPIGTSAITFFQTLGGAIFVSVGNTILLGQLRQAQIPGVDVSTVIAAGANMIQTMIPQASQSLFITAYNSALRNVFLCAVVLAGSAFVCSLGISLRTLKVTNSTVANPHEEDIEKTIERTLRMNAFKGETGEQNERIDSGIFDEITNQIPEKESDIL